MRTSKLAKGILLYLSLVAVMVVAVISMIAAKDSQRKALEPQIKTTTQAPTGYNNPLFTEQDKPQLMIMPESAGPCFSLEIYTSLPPKCKTSDGTFIEVPQTSNAFVAPGDTFMIPERK